MHETGVGGKYTRDVVWGDVGHSSDVKGGIGGCNKGTYNGADRDAGH